MTTAIFLIGLPAAGKSTIRTKLLELYPTATVLSTDDVIETESAKEGITYNDGFQKFIKFATKVLESKLNGAILNNSPIIWDQTNLSVKQRQQKLSKIPKHYKKVAIVVQCDNQAEHDKRLLSRPGKNIPENVIASMRSSFEHPTEAEGFDEIIKIMT